MGGVVGMGALVGVAIAESVWEKVTVGEEEIHMDRERVGESDGEVDTESLVDKVVEGVEDTDRVGSHEVLPRELGLSDSVAFTVTLLAAVEDGDWDALMQLDTVPE